MLCLIVPVDFVYIGYDTFDHITKYGIFTEPLLVWDGSGLFHLEKPPYKDKDFGSNSPGSIHFLPLRLAGESLHTGAKLNFELLIICD